MSPSCCATGWSSASCILSLARADWWPAVTRPSTQSASSSILRACATCDASRTFGIVISMVAYFLLACRQKPHDATLPPCFLYLEFEVQAKEPGGSGARHEVRGMNLVNVIAIGQVENIDLKRYMLGQRVAAHGIEEPVT